jgi:hypothetical protein
VGILRKYLGRRIDETVSSNSISKLTIYLYFALARSKLWLHKLPHPQQELVQLALPLEPLLAPLDP